MSRNNCVPVSEGASQHSQPETGAASQNTLITIGDVQYDIEVSQIPYLSSFVNFQAKAQPQGTNLVHGPIPLFDVAMKGIQSGYRQCFRALPPDISQYHVLCETYEFLGINVLGEQHIDEIFSDLKTCKTDYELEYKHYRAIKGNKSRARDAAFKLLYLILLGDFKDECRDSAKVYNAVLFIVSHSGTFKWRTRTVTRAVYEERFVVSPKQIARLNQWLKGDTEDDIEADITTEEESSDEYYDSDCS